MPSPIDKLKNKFRWRIIIKGNMDDKANELLNNCLKNIYEMNFNKTIISIDVNPNNMY